MAINQVLYNEVGARPKQEFPLLKNVLVSSELRQSCQVVNWGIVYCNCRQIGQLNVSQIRFMPFWCLKERNVV